MDTESQRRVARSEALFRAGNEAIERGCWPGEERKAVRFRCECGRLDCQHMVALTVAEYERVRADPRRFVLAADHDLSDVEEVVESHPSHVVVRKTGAAGREAHASDPRS